MTSTSSVTVRSILKPSSDVRFRIVDREAVVVRQRSAEVLVMSEVAVGSSRVDLQACKLEYSIVSPK